jgi:hypothetical protein
LESDWEPNGKAVGRRDDNVRGTVLELSFSEEAYNKEFSIEAPTAEFHQAPSKHKTTKD